jgi:hypothetical protein
MLDLFGLGQIGTVITAIVGFVGVAWIALFRAKRQGAADATAKRDAQDMEDAYNREVTRNEIDRNATSSDARDRLRKDWRRQ